VKHIRKNDEPEVLANFKAQANDNWQPSYELLRGKDKQQFHHYLISEQGHICCYCGERIIASDSHIEHFQPQTDYPHLELDYFNLLASCQQKIQPKEPRHCGMGKGDWFHPELLVSPLIADCEDFFEYTVDGQILPSKKLAKVEAATQTIDNLRLNIPKLQATRTGAIDSIYNDPDLQLPLSADEIDKLIHYYSCTDEDGKYQPYCQTLLYLLKQERVDRNYV
jgi:uncharacterized protein (TIGR02646 family)